MKARDQSVEKLLAEYEDELTCPMCVDVLVDGTAPC